jgi:hypothetical protein
VIDVEVVELPGGAVSSKPGGFRVDLGLPEQAGQIFPMF